ncbi:MAG: TldD/PmbA family protein [Candidatus Heimdallarchaeota archaeon]|nr:TldD/PmbA family protein [Candidatus Heimdallarchaeota archaeon]MCK4878533.1 TldD/PmbA family protein [Candidatus Heimdallarchaeota archaeon]
MTGDPYDLVEKAIEEGNKLGAKYIEARLVKTSLNTSILKNGVPELGGIIRTNGIGIRVLKNGGLGFASFNEMTKDEMKIAVAFATKMAEATGEKRGKKIVFSDEEIHEADYKSLGANGKRPMEVDPEEKIQRLIGLDKILAELQTGAIIPYRFFQMIDQTEEKYLLTNEGANIKSEIDLIQLFGLAVAVNPNTGSKEQLMIQKGKAGGLEAFDYWKIEEYIEKEAKTLGKIVTEAKEAPKGIIDYVVGPNVIGIMCHENQGHPSEGDRILGREGAQAGESYLNKEMIGERIGSESVTIIDDSTLEGSYGFYLYDDEGVKAKPRYLLNKGIFEDMLHNRESAAFMGTSSTAAARAIGYNREPIPRMANTYLEPGDFTFEEMIEDVKLGVLMQNFTEWNIDDRRYQSKYVGLEAFLIENGEIKHLVRRPIVETTTPKLWGSVDAVAKKDLLEFDAATCGKGDPMQGAPVYHGGSFMRIRKVEVR